MLTRCPAKSSNGGPSGTSRPAAVLPLIAVLRQLAQVIEAMSDEQYCQKPVGVLTSNIGSHIRHCLDHVASLLAAYDSGRLNYDERQRGTSVETNRVAALDVTLKQEADLLAIPVGIEDEPLSLTMLVSPDLAPVEVETTVGRELAFVLSHTIHHNALIGVMAQTLGVPVPARFGYAPATVRHLGSSPCAR